MMMRPPIADARPATTAMANVAYRDAEPTSVASRRESMVSSSSRRARVRSACSERYEP